jgi:hypothetical protein
MKQARTVIEDDLFGIVFGIATRSDGEGNLFFAAEETHDG